MMFAKAVLLCAGLILAGCAERIYLNEPAAQVSGGGGPGANESSPECTAKFRSSGACLALNWEKRPSDNEFGAFTFKIWRENALDGSAVVVDPGASVSVVLWMPSMGHGSSPVTVERLDVGTYRASQVFFSMGGDWEIRIQVKAADGAQDLAVLPYKH